VKVNANLPLVFSAAPAVAVGEPREENGQPVRTFKKEIVQAGKWRHPADGQLIDIPQARLSHWNSQFQAMKANGMKVYVPEDHTRNPDANRGWVTDMEVVGDKLVATMDLIGEDAIKLASRIDVSIQARDLVDGKGNRYPDAIEHTALVADPVITGLNKFVIQLSRAKTLGLSIGGSSMESLKKIAASLGIEAGEMDEAALEAAILAACGKLRAGNEEAATSLSAAQSELATLRLSAKPVDVDPDLLEHAAGNISSQLEVLTMSRQITPAFRDKAKVVLCGADATKRPIVMLSRKAATAAGFSGALAQPFIDLLKELPKPEGDGTTTTLSREGGPKEGEVDQKQIDAVIEKHVGR